MNGVSTNGNGLAANKVYTAPHFFSPSTSSNHQ